jgi:hypothetical protein
MHVMCHMRRRIHACHVSALKVYGMIYDVVSISIYYI